MLRRTCVAIAGPLLAFIAVVLGAGMLQAQEEPDPYEACRPDKKVIDAEELPRVVEQDRCPVAGRAIAEDGGLGSLLPKPNTTVHAEWLTRNGAQELTVANPAGGTFLLGEVGKDVAAKQVTSGRAGAISAQASTDGCEATNYSLNPYRVYGSYDWRFNSGTTPAENDVANVERELRLGTRNITEVDNPCGIGDGVLPGHDYLGRTAASVNISSDSYCLANDGRSVTGFGNLPTSVVGTTCIYALESPAGPGEVVESDLRLNKVDFDWTAEVTSSCNQRQDVQSIATHERGHTFGLDHVGIQTNPYQTMNPLAEPCTTWMRSLGRGDALGLNRRYE